VRTNPFGGAAQFAFSSNGTLAFLAGQVQGFTLDKPMYWMDREGKTTPLLAEPENWSNLSFSPDGRRLATQIHDGKQQDVWIYEWARDTLARLTRDGADDGWPVWSPDGERIVFSSTRADGATFNLYWQRADGTGEAVRIAESEKNQWATSWHPSGKFLAFFESSPQTGSDVMILPIEGDEASGWKPGKPTTHVNDAYSDHNPMFSPDGRWLAYQNGGPGERFQVYVRPFPGPGGRLQISTDGGVFPTWSRTGRELFYGTSDPSRTTRIMVVPYRVEGDSFVAEKPRLWSDGGYRWSGDIKLRPFDLHPDGQRFALALPEETEAQPKHVVLVFDFFEELRRIAPAGKR
jgi:serine/threonine-protein kinase